MTCKLCFLSMESSRLFQIAQNKCKLQIPTPSWHGSTCSRTHRHKEWVGRVTEFASSAALNQIQGLLNLKAMWFTARQLTYQASYQASYQTFSSSACFLKDRKAKMSMSKRKSQEHLLFKLLRVLAIILVEVGADLCCESESGWHR